MNVNLPEKITDTALVIEKLSQCVISKAKGIKGIQVIFEIRGKVLRD